MAEQTFAEQIQRLRELEAKAYPAPWGLTDQGVVVDRDGEPVFGEENRQLIVEARNLLPSLLKEREEMQERIRQLEEALRVSTDPPPKDGWESLIPDLREAVSRKGYEGGYVDAWYSCEMAEWLLAKLAPLEEGKKDGR